MNKFIFLIAFIVIVFQFSSCKDEEVSPAIISFSKITSTVSEGVGTASIAIKLDKAAPGEIEVSFTLLGTAQANSDYTTTGLVKIPSGSLEGVLMIDIIDDAVFEFDPEVEIVFGEALQITLSGVSGNGKLSESSDDLNHLLIIQENDPVARSLTIGLSWDAGDMTPGDVDMDLILFFIDPSGNASILAAANSIGINFEAIAVGTPAPDGIYGLAYRYFEGSSDNVTFTATFTAENGTLPGGGSTTSFTGLYTQANVNGDMSENATVEIVQTFEKKGLNYIAISAITIPATGSRGKGLLGIAPQR